MQQLIREAEQQTAIDKANRERQGLRVSPEGVAMPSDLAENRAKAMEEGLALYEQQIASQEGGQRTIPGVEPRATIEKVEQPEATAKSDIDRAVDYLQTLSQEFKSAPKIKEALAKTEFKDLKANQVLQQYKQTPVQTSLFEEPKVAKKFSKSQLNVNANNQPIAQTPEATKNFWNWFGASKVADAEGKPVVMYHGTDADFDTFDPNAIRTEGRRTAVDSGISLSFDPAFASKYASKENGKVVPVYVNAEHIWTNNEQGIEDAKIAYEDRYNEPTPDYILEKVKEGHWSGLEGFLKQLRDYGGYDGIAINEAGKQNLIVFDSAQVKSAVGNKGTFNPEESSIVKSTAKATTNAHTTDSLQQALTKRYGKDAPKVNLGTRADADGDATVQGFYDPATQSVTLIPENIDQSKDIHSLIRHEVAVHAKQLGKTDAEFQSILKQLKALKNNKAVQDAYTRVPKDTATENIDEEALGYLVEHAKELPIVKRFMSWLRRMAYKLTGSSNWLRVDDFSKLADEVLSSKTKPSNAKQKKVISEEEQVIRYSVKNKLSPEDEKILNSTGVLQTPPARKESFLSKVKSAVSNLKTAESRDEIMLKLRQETVHHGAGLENFMTKKADKSFKDALGNSVLYMAKEQSYASSALIENSIDKGQIIVDPKTGLFKVETNKNNIGAIANKLKALSDRIGEENAANLFQIYSIGRTILADVKMNSSLEAQAVAAEKSGNKEKAEKLRDSKVKHSNQQIQAAKDALASKIETRHPEVKEAHEIWQGVNKNLINFLLASGRISNKEALRYLSNTDYAPTQRVLESLDETHPGLANSFKIHKRKGSENLAFNDVLDNMINHYILSTSASMDNMINAKMLPACASMSLDKNGNPKLDLWQHIPKHQEKNAVPIWVNGVKKYAIVEDPDVAIGFKSLAGVNHPLFSAMIHGQRIIRNSITGFPLFNLRSVLKDMDRVALLSGGKSPFMTGGKVFGHYFKNLINPNNKQYQELQSYLGSAAYGMTSEARRERIRRKHGLGNQNLFLKVEDLVAKFAEIADNAQRSAIYDSVLKETGDKTLALRSAQQIISWHHHGANDSIRAWVPTVMFMHAYSQSMDVLARALFGKGIGNRDRKIVVAALRNTIAKLATFTTAYALLMAAAGGDDYDRMNLKQKINNFILPGTDFKIPVAQEIAFFKGMPEAIIQYLKTRNSDKPLDWTTIRNTFIKQAADAFMAPDGVSQVIRIPLEIQSNYDSDLGIPIVGHVYQNLEPWKQYSPNTSEISKLMGEIFNVSPLKSDYLVKNAFGTFGAAALGATDQMVGAMSQNAKPAKKLKEIPGVSSFFVSDKNMAATEAYYDLYNKVEKAHNTYKSLEEEDGDDEATDKYLDKNEKLLDVYKDVQKLSKKMAKLRKEKESVYADESLSAKDKQQDLDFLLKDEAEILDEVFLLRDEAGL
jgi:hypothetical protein